MRDSGGLCVSAGRRALAVVVIGGARNGAPGGAGVCFPGPPAGGARRGERTKKPEPGGPPSATPGKHHGRLGDRAKNKKQRTHTPHTLFFPNRILREQMMQKIGVTGQESMSRLLLAPFTFIAPSELNSLADLLVSAISFLEGNSSDDVETFVDIEASSSNQVVANFGLTLVPYKSSLDVESSPKITPRITFDSKTRFSSNFVLSRKPAVEPGQPTVRLDEYFKDLYQVDREMSAALRAAEVNNAEYILDAAFETGLNTSDETLLFVLSKMTRTGAQYENSGLLKKIIQHMELEHNTEPTIIGCAVLPDSGPMGHPPERRASRLAQKRSQGKRK